MRHKLKTWPECYRAVDELKKTFEIRKNDRDFKVGDTLVLQEWDPKTEEYTGREMVVFVTYITDFGQVDGSVVMGFK